MQKAWRSSNERKIFVESIGAPNIQSLCYALREHMGAVYPPTNPAGSETEIHIEYDLAGFISVGELMKIEQT